MTPDQLHELGRPAVAVAYFVEFHFKSGIQRACTFNVNVEWNGHTWLGLGLVGDISEVEQSKGVAKPLNFTLPAADLALVALANGPADEYRGGVVKMWMCPISETYQLIDEPELCWSGTMSAMGIEIPEISVGEEATGSISLRCETSANGLRRPNNLRLNPAQHRSRYPDDPSLDYLPDLIGKPIVWLPKELQMV